MGMKQEKNLIAVILLLWSMTVFDTLYYAESKVLANNWIQRVVYVENFTIPVDKDGTFYIFERHPHKVVLQEYPAFYFNETME